MTADIVCLCSSATGAERSGAAVFCARADSRTCPYLTQVAPVAPSCLRRASRGRRVSIASNCLEEAGGLYAPRRRRRRRRCRRAPDAQRVPSCLPLAARIRDDGVGCSRRCVDSDSADGATADAARRRARARGARAAVARERPHRAPRRRTPVCDDTGAPRRARARTCLPQRAPQARGRSVAVPHARGRPSTQRPQETLDAPAASRRCVPVPRRTRSPLSDKPHSTGRWQSRWTCS